MSHLQPRGARYVFDPSYLSVHIIFERPTSPERGRVVMFEVVSLGVSHLTYKVKELFRCHCLK